MNTLKNQLFLVYGFNFIIEIISIVYKILKNSIKEE